MENVCVVIKIWVPSEANDLKLRIVVEAPSRDWGHRAYQATLKLIRRTNWWIKMKRNVKEFIQARIHCIISQSSDRMPLPLPSILHGDKPNDVVQPNFLFTDLSDSNNIKPILLIKGDLSTYSWLHPCSSTDRTSAANAIAK